MKINNRMYTTVMEKLNFEPRVDASNITISIQGNGDIVLLAGSIGSFAEKLIAEKAVRRLTNVTTVTNDISVNLSMKYEKTDVEIANDVTNALHSIVFIPSENIKVVIKNGVVNLSGEVHWQYQKNNTFNAIKNIFGIKSIVNNIAIKSSITIDISHVKDNIIKEFERHASIDASKISIETEGKKITLKGMVHNFDEKEDAATAAWSIPGVENVENKITIDWLKAM